MTLSYLLKSVPWQAYVRPMLLLSLGLHTFALLLPFPASEPIKPEAAPEEEAISLTQLSSTPTNAVKPAPSPVQIPRVTPTPVVRASIAPLIRPASPLPAISAPPQVSVPPAVPSPAASAQSDPFIANFPRYPSAQPGSFGLPANFDPFSFKTVDALSTVAAWFQQQLQSRQFLSQTIEQVDQTGRAVYRVAKEGKTKYLTLIPNADGAGTTYLLSDQPLPSDLGSTPVISLEEQQFYGDLAQIIPSANPTDPIWQEVDNPTVLPDPNAFYANLGSINLQQGDIPEKRSGIQRSVMAIGQSDPQTLFSSWTANLDAYGYTIAPHSSYGGGSLYQLSRDGVTGFISLVPTSRGTAIYIWNRSPN